MIENAIPKWQKELRSFLGIKSGIILEGNVYDEYPIFDFEGEDARFDSFDKIDRAIIKLADKNSTTVIFFDPIEGFYCSHGSVDAQRQLFARLFEGYQSSELLKDNGNTLCMMPTGKQADSKNTSDSKKYLWASEIVRRAILENEDAKKFVFVLNFASRLEPCNLSEADSNIMFLNIMAATTYTQKSQVFCNSVIMIVDKYNDIPTWVYLNNPNIRTIPVCVPDRNTRRLFLENLYDELAVFRLLSDENYAPGKQFVAETEGLQLQELKQTLQLAFRKGITPECINIAFKQYKYGVLDDPWEKLENDILADIEKKLNERVKGQDAALKKVKTVITRAVKGLSGLQHSGAAHKPKGILFFAGPTGVGKTETAKALAESIFGDENACIRFDMSEYREAQSDQRLFGSPPGYVGYEVGGQLTNAIKNRPFSVLLFDEIEKAHPTILDKFLQILEDGRMTDNQGNTVYFGETVIIFTSNIGLTKETRDIYNSTPHRIPTITIENPQKEDTPEFQDKVTALLTDGVKSYFTDIGRPELLNRLGDNNIVVFQFINVKDAMVICDYKLQKICETIETDKNIKIITSEITEMLHEKAVLERVNGGRGVSNMLERVFLNPLANYICTLPNQPSVLRCHCGNNGVEFEVMSGES